MQNSLGYISLKSGVLQTLEGNREDRLCSNQARVWEPQPGNFLPTNVQVSHQIKTRNSQFRAVLLYQINLNIKKSLNFQSLLSVGMTDRVLCKYMIQIRSLVLTIHVHIQLKKMGVLALQGTLPTCCCGRFYRRASCFSHSDYLRRKTKPTHFQAFPRKPEQTDKGVAVLLLKNTIINNIWRKFSLAPGRNIGIVYNIWETEHTGPMHPSLM